MDNRKTRETLFSQTLQTLDVYTFSKLEIPQKSLKSLC